MQYNLSLDEVIHQIAEADSKISESDFDTLDTWLKSKIKPALWQHKQYKFDEKFWVVAILNRTCLYFNLVEEGWGWGKYTETGFIEYYHWEQDELYEAFIWRYRNV